MAPPSREWIDEAADLFRFHERQGWCSAGYPSFQQWLDAQGRERSRAFKMLAAYRELVVRRGVEPERLRNVGLEKIRRVMPALRRGDLTVEEALADEQRIYVIQGVDGGPIKIGVTSGLAHRLEELQAGNWVTLRCVAAWPQHNGHAVEAFIHRRFAAARLRGEWFDADYPAVAAWLKMVTVKYPPPAGLRRAA